MLAGPISELPKRDLTLALLNQEITRFKILKASPEEGGAIIFNGLADRGAGRDPDLRFVYFRFNADQDVGFTDVIPKSNVLFFDITNQQFASVQCLNRSLIIQFELANG